MKLLRTRCTSPARLSSPLAAALLCAAALSSQAASCPPLCVQPQSVKNAAGIDPKLYAGLVFARGDASIAASAPSVERIVQAWKAAGGKGVVALRVQADTGLRAAAATTQAKARAAALAKALVDAGIPAASVQVSAR